MEFDNPAAGGQWGSNPNSESEISGSEAGSSKKEKNILGSSKKKDKEKKRDKEKESKYAHLDDESSNDDDDGGKSSSGKSKKKAFKIGLAKKEKKEKKEKEAKEKELEMKDSKEAKEAKRKDKKDKPKLKLKKSKHTDSESDKNGKSEEAKWPPIFGVALEVAVERSRSHDGVALPVVVRECVDFIEEQGLQVEGIYRSSGVKSKVVKLRTAYSSRQPVDLSSADPPVVASLLKLFLRELPDPVLTARLIPSFEEVSQRRAAAHRLEGLRALLQELPEPNLRLVQWVFVHMGHVIQKERVNKMTLQNVSIVLSPTMQISHRVLNCIFEHSSDLFAGVTLTKYIPPICGPSVRLPESLAAIQEEMRKQESLLAELHHEISSGVVVAAREEQLWEQQRIVTQLKRNLRLARARGEEAPRAQEPEEEELDFALQVPQVPQVPQAQGHLEQLPREVPKDQEQTPTDPTERKPAEKKEAAVEESAAQPEGLSSPEATEQEEHRVTVQVHRDSKEANANKKEGKAHVTVIKLNQDKEKVEVTEKPEETKSEEAAAKTSPGGAASRSQELAKESSGTVEKEETKAGNDEEKVREKVSFSSTGLPSSRPAGAPIPLLPPPPPSSKPSSRGAAQQQRALAPPEHRVKSRSLPRGLPSDGVYEGFEAPAEAAEEAGREALLLEEMRLRFEFEELLNLKSELERRRRTERREIAELQEEIATMQTLYQYRTYSVDSSEESSGEEDGARSQEQRAAKLQLLARLRREKRELEQRKVEMQAQLAEERGACLQLRVDIRMEQERIQRRGGLL